jgi:hypothetical protein
MTTHRPLTRKQETALMMMPEVYRWTAGSLPSLRGRGLVTRDRVTQGGRSRWEWSLTDTGRAEAVRVREERRAESARDRD